MGRLQFWCGIVARMTALFFPLALAPARAAEEPDLIFKRSTGRRAIALPNSCSQQ